MFQDKTSEENKINYLVKPTDEEIEKLGFKSYEEFMDHWVHAL